MSENLVLSLLQTLHNIGGVLFTAGPVYLLIILTKSKRVGEDSDYWMDKTMYYTFSIMPLLWMSFLVIQVITGGALRLTPIFFYGVMPSISPIAKLALIVKVICVIIAFAISFYMWRFMLPSFQEILNRVGTEGRPSKEDMEILVSLHRKRESLLIRLIVLAAIILTGAAFLRWNS